MVIWLITFLLELKGKLNLISMISQLLVVITMVAEIEAVLSVSNQWEQRCVAVLCMLSLLYAFLEYLDFWE